MYSILHFQRIMSKARSLRFKAARYKFLVDYFAATVYPHKEAKMYTFDMVLGGRHLDWQVVSAAQVFGALKEVFSTVEDIALDYDRHNLSPEWNSEAERTRWRELLGAFDIVKTLLRGRWAH